MIQPTKHKYMYSSPENNNSIILLDKEKIDKQISNLINNSSLLQLKGLGSKVSNLNWKLFFGVETFNPDKETLTNFNLFNDTIYKWFQVKLNNISSNKVVIQYDGDKLLEDNYKNSDTLLQNYTGVLVGLINYLLQLGKEVHILCILDKPENKWDKNIDYYWENGFNQILELGVHIHFWIYSLLDSVENKERINKLNIKRLDNNPTEIWGYKGFWNMNYLHSLHYNEVAILNFGLGEVVIDEFTYLKYLNSELFDKIKDKIFIYYFTRMFDVNHKAVCYKTLDHEKYIQELKIR
jgi:hypothetical protein